MKLFTILLVLSIDAFASAADRAEIVIADFESETYGDWKAEGTAFGSGPAKGTLPGQMQVEGYEGERLVNSFVDGDKSTGSLTSPQFRIERKFVNFLVGGGGYDETAVELIVDGKTLRRASGPNTQPGGSERLDWKTWQVSDLTGKTASIRILDDREGGWGHINVDQIVQSDQQREAQPASRVFRITKRYLHLPVWNRAFKRRVQFTVDGKTVREFEINAADGEPDFYVFSDVSPFEGKELKIELRSLPFDSQFLNMVTLADEVPGRESLYNERLRPQFHFTSRRGWLNDPNGLVFYEGEWHLFYQHNPFGVQWGNMHWGHAVSHDLFHWQELPIALYPKEFGDWAFSGSAVVDAKNSSGFGDGEQPPLVLAYTSTGRGECISYSNDRGRTWTEFDGNPVVKHQGRDPKLIWHEPTQRWVMGVYQEKKAGDDAEGRFIAFYSSPDLKDWKFESRIEGFFECPDLFELKTEDGKQSRWVLYAADGEYLLGDFDGKAFTPSSAKQKLWHGNFYAAQTFDHVPEGRRVQIGWARGIEFPHMPFNQQMTVPVELSLRRTDAGLQLFAWPVKELDNLHENAREQGPIQLTQAYSLLDGADRPLGGEQFDLECQIELRDAKMIEVTLPAFTIAYYAETKELSVGDEKAPLLCPNGVLDLRVLVDRGSVEVFANKGAVAISVPPQGRTLSYRTPAVTVRGGAATIQELKVAPLKSVWNR